MKTKSNITTLDQILDKKYGKKDSLNASNGNNSLNRLDWEFCWKKQEQNWE